jgi:hypothetical protein
MAVTPLIRSLPSAAPELLVDLGFDIDAKGRRDVPRNQPWHTALDGAVEHGNRDLGRTRLRLGADPDITDQRLRAAGALGYGGRRGTSMRPRLVGPPLRQPAS